MIEYCRHGVYIKNGYEIMPEKESPIISGRVILKEEAAQNTISYQIMSAHHQHGNNDSQDDGKLWRLKFDSLASHDLNYVGIIQTICAADRYFDKFPMPYVLTNCHNSLCAVGGTSNADDHAFGLSAAKKYGGTFVPPNIAVIHQYVREAMAVCGCMILGSDSHTRYGPLGVMGFGEGGGELVKQLLGHTYDIPMPEVVGVLMTGTPCPGVGPQDVALTLIGEVFASGVVKNKILEFFGPGIKNLTVEYRMGIDVMTTETTCLSSIWVTDEKVAEYFSIHGRPRDYSSLQPGNLAYYDGLITIDLSKIVPMIAMPFHPSHVYTIEFLQNNTADILRTIEQSVDTSASPIHLLNLCLPEGGMRVNQGIITGCAGGLYEPICRVAEILQMSKTSIPLSIYPASQPIYLSLIENGVAAKLMKAGVIIKNAFCGPCFGAGDVPGHNYLSIRHTTRNFLYREGAKPNMSQSAAVALMDALSIAATSANGGVLTAANQYIDRNSHIPTYCFNDVIYSKQVYEGFGKADSDVLLVYGPGIRNWPSFHPLTKNVLLCVASFITDEVTTTDELIPSGETAIYRSNPYALAEHTLSRRDPAYVMRAKQIAKWEQQRMEGTPIHKIPELKNVLSSLVKYGCTISEQIAIGSVVYVRKPGDGSAREQAASCQKMLGGLANIAQEYATMRYRSNLINWGMLPLILLGDPPFGCDDFIFIPNVSDAIHHRIEQIPAYVLRETDSTFHPVFFGMEPLTAEEAETLLAGCLINKYGKENLRGKHI